MSKVTVTAYAEGCVTPSAIKMSSSFVPTKAVIKPNKDVCTSVRKQYTRNWFLGASGCELWIPVTAMGELLTAVVVNHKTREYRTIHPGELTLVTEPQEPSRVGAVLRVT